MDALFWVWFVVIPLLGFGWLLMTVGRAQDEARKHRYRNVQGENSIQS